MAKKTLQVPKIQFFIPPEVLKKGPRYKPPGRVPLRPAGKPTGGGRYKKAEYKDTRLIEDKRKAENARRLAWAMVITNGSDSKLKKNGTQSGRYTNLKGPERIERIRKDLNISPGSLRDILKGTASPAMVDRFWSRALNDDKWGRPDEAYRAAALTFLSKHSKSPWSYYEREFKRTDDLKARDKMRYKLYAEYFENAGVTKKADKNKDSRKSFRDVFGDELDQFEELDQMFDEDVWYLS